MNIDYNIARVRWLDAKIADLDRHIESLIAERHDLADECSGIVEALAEAMEPDRFCDEFGYYPSVF